jgi:hypothetical protein
MPKKKTTKNAMDQIAWVDKLPESAWGRGITQTVRELDKELEPLRAQFEELSEKIAARESIIKDAIKRAEREAKGLFSDNQIADAKKTAEKEQEKKAKAAEGSPKGSKPDAKPDADADTSQPRV